jgi:hypothetical protein
VRQAGDHLAEDFRQQAGPLGTPRSRRHENRIGLIV